MSFVMPSKYGHAPIHLKHSSLQIRNCCFYYYLSSLADQELHVLQMYNLAYDKAKEIFEGNFRVLEKIVEELLEYEMLTQKDLQRIFEENGGVREKEPFFLSKFSRKEVSYQSTLDGGNGSAVALLNAPSSN